jgi:hypothetical protein
LKRKFNLLALEEGRNKKKEKAFYGSPKSSFVLGSTVLNGSASRTV